MPRFVFVEDAEREALLKLLGGDSVSEELGRLRQLLEEEWALAEDELAYIEGARQHHEKDGELEFDAHPLVSVSDEQGAYVLGWVWVRDDEAGITRDPEPDVYKTGTGEEVVLCSDCAWLRRQDSRIVEKLRPAKPGSWCMDCECQP